ncbi:hypothetical protein [Microlunatus endophyticus]|uniref:hypothetical protein n=1 Tax=Microlunatus endophyticus TaxID=1716077 RepID=UPI001E6120BD|nr:hypothetical protein [Microlunatus endophyticus]
MAVTLATWTHGHISAEGALLTLAVTLVGTVLAVFTADAIAHIVSHGRLMTRAEFVHAVRASFGALPAVVLPFLFLGIAAVTDWDVGAALLASTIALVLALVFLAWSAVRRVDLPWWQRPILLGILALLALLVIALQVLAHS